MNKKDVAEIRKQFKHENMSLNMHKISSAFVSAKEKRILFSETKRFDMMTEENAALYYQNFKKMLTGDVGKKLHELEFVETESKEKGQKLLFDVHRGNASPDSIMKAIAEKLDYPMNYVISIIFGKYAKASKGEDSDYNYNFILCTVNYVDRPKMAMQINYSDKEIVPTSSTDVNIDLSAPIDGFLYPAFNNNCEDANRVLYSGKRANNPNLGFIEEILGSEIKMTAEEENNKFSDLLKHGLGDTIEVETLHSIYEQLNARTEASKDSEIPTIGLKGIRRLLESCEVDDVKIKRLEERFEDEFGSDDYEIKTTSLIPSFSSKSVKVVTSAASFSVNPVDLTSLKPIIYNGKKCLLIEMNSDVEIDGYMIKHK